MHASRWIAVWMALGVFGSAGTGVGCGDGDTSSGTTYDSTTTTTTGEGSTSSSSSGGTGGAGGTGTGGAGGTGTGGAGGTGTGGAGGTGTGGAGGEGTGGSGGMMDPMFAFTLNGINYTGVTYASKTVYVTLSSADETTAALDESVAIADDGTFTITGHVLGGRPYTMRWYVDVNDNGVCDAVPNDRVWMEDIPAVAADVIRSVEPNTDFSACP
ncbi:hypothetical protein [Sorangium sp. So ce887]|uniref:hypothetical protein n=1 Tax=Sorangium sp. So ce887 TaxID=3133324 RepID=UPI003F60A352